MYSYTYICLWLVISLDNRAVAFFTSYWEVCYCEQNLWVISFGRACDSCVSGSPAVCCYRTTYLVVGDVRHCMPVGFGNSIVVEDQFLVFGAPRRLCIFVVVH